MNEDYSLFQDINKHADIVKIISSYLNVIKKGKNYLAVCPFHDDTKPSLTISPEKQIYKCFACGASGNAIKFVKEYEHVSYMEAARKVAELSDYHPEGLEQKVKTTPVDEKRNNILKCLRDLSTYYSYILNTEEGKDGLSYLDERHLDSSMRNKYKLGFAPRDGKATCLFLQSKGHSLKTIEDTGISMMSGGVLTDKNQGRAIFTICDKDGNVIGFSARRIKNTDESKYINSPETYVFHKSNILYNYHLAKDEARHKGYIYLLEGFMDVFALAKIGIDAAVALMGTALTSEHIAMLRILNAEVRICLDGDLAGQTATRKAANALKQAGIPFRIIDTKGSLKDPDEILNEDGEEALRVYLEQLISHIDFELNYFTRSNPLKTDEEKKALIKQFLPVLLSLRNQFDFDNYVIKLAKVTGFAPEAIKQLVSRVRNSQEDENETETVIKNFHPERKIMKRLQLVEREVLFQMLSHRNAVEFYENNIDGFFDKICRSIANYVVEFSKENPDMELSDLITYIDSSEINNKDQIIKEMTELSLEETHPTVCDDALLEGLLKSIKDEKKRIFEEDTLKQSLQDKSEMEKARLLADHYRRIMHEKK